MSMEVIAKKLHRNFKDMKELGPLIITRALRKPDRRGYSVIKTRHGEFFFRRSDTDFWILRQIFVDREYDLDRFPQGKIVKDAYNDLILNQRTPLIIDAGANAGYSSRFFAQMYPLAQIFAVEPASGNAALCRANVANFTNIEVVEAAVGSQPGIVQVEHQDGYSYSARTRRSEPDVVHGPGTIERAPVVTIDELKARVGNGELLIVKVDIEGFESDLFENATWVSQTRAVIVEPHDWMLPGARTSRSLQKAMLKEDRDLLISGDTLVWIKVD